MTQTMFLVVACAYALLLIVISMALKQSSSANMQSYGKASNRFGIIVMSLVSMGAWVGSGGLIGLSNSSYSGGIGAYWGYAMAYIALVPWMFLYIKRIKILDILTIPDFFALRYSKHNEIIKYPATLLILVRNATVLAMQLSALAFLFTSFLGWPRFQGVVISAVLVLIYTSISGFLSVMVTNTLQSALQTIAPFAVAIFAVSAAGGWDQVKSVYDAAGEIDKLNLFTGVNWYTDVFYYFISVGLFFIIGDQSDWQRVNAASNAKTARNGFLIGTVLVLPILVLPCIAGATAKLILPPDTNPSLIYFEIIKICPPIVGILLLIGALATILSCVSAYLFAGGTNISNDIIIRWKEAHGTKLTDGQKIFYTRLGIGINTLIGIAFALWISGILDLFTTGLVISAAGLLVPYLFAWHSKTMNTEGAIAGMIVGGGLSFLWMILGNPFGIDAVWLGIPASLIACLVVKPMFPAPTEDEISSTFYYSPKFTKEV